MNTVFFDSTTSDQDRRRSLYDGQLYLFGVRKSGPRHEDTKFLVYRHGWRWVRAGEFSPAEQPAELCGAVA